MDASTKKVLGLSESTDADIEAAETMVKAEAAEFLSVGKRKEYGWNQAVNARFFIDHIAVAWDTLSPCERAVACHLLSNASQFRQTLEKAGTLPKRVDDWT